MEPMLLLSVILLGGQGSDAPPLLLRRPTLSQNKIVFQFAGDLWQVPRSGGDATRLTSAAGVEASPLSSPDGSVVAFTGQYDGNTDIYVVPADGGIPRRLTYHPAADVVAGWAPDGRSILFTSTMQSDTQAPRLF